MVAGIIKAAMSIILLGKDFDFTWSPHVVPTLNSMFFLLLLFFVPAYSAKVNPSRPMCASSHGEWKVANKI